MSGRVPSESSAQRRREERRSQLESHPGGDHEEMLDALALMDLAWHDCYGESCPPDAVVEDVLTIARGDLDALVRAAHLAVIDFRDTRIAADAIRTEGTT